ncbi:hypothetical protein BC826DRAFT_1055145 [Russula brevipes]|nr:hypothetical protein BC826DRAFT_1055145 [Russula brevipes]
MTRINRCFNVRGSLLDSEFIHFGERNGPERARLCAHQSHTNCPVGNRRESTVHHVTSGMGQLARAKIARNRRA